MKLAHGLVCDPLKVEPRPQPQVDDWIFRNEVVPRMKAAGFEARYHRRITDWQCGGQQSVFDACQERCVRVGATIVLTGVRGTGKTTICAQMCRVRAENEALPPWERQPPYRKLCDLIARYKPLYADYGTTDADMLIAARDALCTHPLLFVDEIHDCDDQKMKDRVLCDLIDRRYSRLVDTILISNQTPEEFQSSNNDSLLSRITEHGMIIPCTWQSWRTQQ